MDASQTANVENKDNESDGQGIPTERSEDGEDETQGPSASVVKSSSGVQEQLEGGEAEDGENIAEPAQNNAND